MPTINLLQLLALIRQRLLTIDGITQSNVAWMAKKFVPPAAEPPQLWYREFLMPGDNTLAATQTNEALGIVTYEVMYPRDKGVEVPMAAVTAIVAGFPLPLKLSGLSSVYKVVPGKSYPDNEQGNWQVHPVLIYYRTFAVGTATTTVTSVAQVDGGFARWTFSSPVVAVNNPAAGFTLLSNTAPHDPLFLESAVVEEGGTVLVNYATDTEVAVGNEWRSHGTNCTFANGGTLTDETGTVI